MAWLSGWSYREKITIASSGKGLSGNVTSKTIPIHITSANIDFWAGVKADGTDVRFTSFDGATLLDFETRSFDNGVDDAIYHVEVPTILSASNTDIYIYYGNAGASSGENITATWGSAYRGVWHLDQNKAAGAFVDSTNNANNGTNSGTTDAAGQIGRGRQFTAASSQYISLADADSLSFGNGTTDTPIIISAWINPTTAAGFRIFSKGSTAVEYAFSTSALGKLFFRCEDMSAAANFYKLADVAIGTGSLIHIGAYYDGSAAHSGVTIFQAGASVAATGTLSGTYTAMENLGDAGAIGKWYTALYANGVINELILMDATGLTTTTAADWMTLEYQGGLGTWLSFAAEEAYLSLADTGGGVDAVNRPAIALTISDTGGGTDGITVAITGLLKAISDTGGGIDTVIIDDGTIHLYLADTGGGVDAVNRPAIALTISDTGGGTDSPSIVVKLLTITDSGGGVDTILAVNNNTLFFTYSNIPSGETVEYMIEDHNGVEHTAWTSVNVTEKVLGNGKSTYKVTDVELINGFQGLIIWRVSGKTQYTRTYTLNYLETWVTGYNALPTLEQMIAGGLALEATASTRLAAADFIAPDNAGIAAIQVDIATAQTDITSILAYAIAMSKWKNNRLARTVAGTTETWVLYDDDSTTPMLTWTNNISTRVRTKAT